MKKSVLAVAAALAFSGTASAQLAQGQVETEANARLRSQIEGVYRNGSAGHLGARGRAAVGIDADARLNGHGTLGSELDGRNGVKARADRRAEAEVEARPR